MENKKIYIYGFVPNFYTAGQFRDLKELGVSAIPYQNISAIVSETDNHSVANLSKDLLASMLIHHQMTIEKLLDRGFSMILPMQLGSIVSSKEEVQHLLKNHSRMILKALQKVENMIEIELVATWNNLSNVFEEISGQDNILKIKQAFQKDNNGFTQENMYKIGLMVKEELDKRKKEIETNIISLLSKLVIDKKNHELMNDAMVSNTAFLLNKKDQFRFESMVDQLDEEWNGELDFKLVGPLPCYSFYTLKLRKIELGDIMAAKDLLGLKDVVSENEVRRSFLEKAKLFHPDKNESNSSEKAFKDVKNAHQVLLDYLSIIGTNSKDEHISLITEGNTDLLKLIVN